MTSRPRRLLPHLFAVVLVALAGCTIGEGDDAPDEAESPLDSALPIIGLANKCLDVRFAGTDNGTPVQLRTCDGTVGQRWTRKDGSLVGIDGKCLDVRWGGTGNGTPLQIYDCNGTAAQQWTFTKGSLVGLANKCADVAGSNSADGTPVDLWDCTGAPNQKWRFGTTATDAGTDSPPAPPTGGSWAGVLSANRAADWSRAGIPGGVPSGTWTQCGSTISAIGSSESYASPSTIIDALSSCNGKSQYVLLGSGDFYLNAAIYAHGLSNVELRGSGPTQTRLHFSSSSTCQNGNGSCLVGFATNDGNFSGSPGTPSNWTAGYTQGSNTITLSSGAGIKKNSTLLVLDQCDTGFSGETCAGSAVDNGNFFNCEDYWTSPGVGCSYTGSVGAERKFRGQQEVVEATSCSPTCGGSGPTTVTITPALHHPNWASTQTPQVWTIQPSRYVGVKDLLIDGHDLPYSAVVTGIGFSGTSYFWVQNVVLDSLPNITIFVTQGAAHGQIESNYIYNSGQSNAATDSSAINYFGSDNLITNNIVQNSHIAIVGNGPLSGNVVSYNYMVNALTSNSVLYESIDDGHSNGNDYNLYEGNVGTMVAMDQAHGTHLVNSFYRNFFSGWESCANGNCGSDKKKTDNLFTLMPVSDHRYGNYVANVLGTPGVTSSSCGGVYEYTNAEWYKGGPGDCGNVWNVGSGNTVSPPDYAGPIPIDPVVGKTIMRWGNWDALNGSTQWNTSEVPTSPPANVLPNAVPTACTSGGTCPASFYLSARPSWWSSSVPFPAIGPDVVGGNVGQCTGTLDTPGQYAGVAATSSSQCTGTSLKPAWDGHISAIPAMVCYLKLNGAPDGTGSKVSFDAKLCY